MTSHLQSKLRHPFWLERARIPKVHEAIGHVELIQHVSLHFVEPANRAAFWTGDAHVGRIIFLAPVLIPDLRSPLFGYVRIAFGTANAVHVFFRCNREARSSIDATHIKSTFTIAGLHLERLG